jgi:hypothetical protein
MAPEPHLHREGATHKPACVTRGTIKGENRWQRDIPSAAAAALAANAAAISASGLSVGLSGDSLSADMVLATAFFARLAARFDFDFDICSPEA